MSILDTYFNLLEGADDQKFRTLASNTFKGLLKAFGSVNPSDLKLPKAGKPVVSVNLGELLKKKQFKNLELWIMAVEDVKGVATRGRFFMSLGGKPARIELYVSAPKNVLDVLTPESWKQVVQKKIVQILPRMQDVFTHEFIHYLDIGRMNPDTREKAVDKSIMAAQSGEDSKYYTDPLEYNAFLQQGLTKIQNYIGNTKSKAKVERVIGKTPTEFYNLVLKVIPPEMKKNMNDVYKNKLKKRVAQMWTDTMGRFNGEAK